MPTVYDVPADALIRRLADHLRRLPQLTPPAWTMFAKTGACAERPPQERDWWHVRAASLLRKLYIHGPQGVGDLKSKYGGRKSRSYYPAHHEDAGGAIVRKALQQLEEAGLVAKQAGKGRVLTGRGVSLLDRLSAQIFKEMVKEKPVLTRYG